MQLDKISKRGHNLVINQYLSNFCNVIKNSNTYTGCLKIASTKKTW
jgi:hypothetical protein